MSEIQTLTEDEARAAVADWLHQTYGGKIGYCLHDGSYRRCEVDAMSLLAALGISGDVTVVSGRLELADALEVFDAADGQPAIRGRTDLYRVVPPHPEPGGSDD